jgi:hypothetical protein
LAGLLFRVCGTPAKPPPPAESTSMAKIIDIPISGKVGLNVNMPGRYGQIRRAWVVPANPNTAPQLAVRGRLAAQARRFDSLDATAQDAWNTAAANQRTAARLGSSGPMTGLQYFVKLNCVLTLLGQDPIDAPPVVPSIDAPAPQNAVITNTGGTIAIKLTVPTSPGTNTTLWASTGVNSGVRRMPALKFLGMCPTPVTGSSDITSLYVSTFGAIQPGTRIFISVKKTDQGFYGPATVFSALVPAS